MEVLSAGLITVLAHHSYKDLMLENHILSPLFPYISHGSQAYL
jgi:hypothetical protein